MRKDIFVLIIGHGRGGTSAVMGFLNLFPDINIAQEKNHTVFFNDFNRVKAPKLSYGFNGNKIVLSDVKKMSFSDLEFCFENRKIIMHERFVKIKPVIVLRDTLDTLCSKYVRARESGKSKYKKYTVDYIVDNWIHNASLMKKIIVYFGEDFFIFDFYEFINQKKIKKDLLKYIGIDYSDEFLNKKVSAGIYGVNKLDVKLAVFGPNSRSKWAKERREIEDVLRERLGEDWMQTVPKF